MLSLARALHLYYTQNEDWEGNTQVLEVPELSVRFQPRSFANGAFSQARTPFLPPGHTLPTSCSAFPCRMNPGCAAKGKLLGKLLPEKLRK